MEYLHIYSRAFVFHRKPESGVGFLRVVQMETLAYTPTKPVAVFKPSRREKRSVQVKELNHPLLREFPQDSLVSRTTSDVDSPAPPNVAPFHILGSVHGLKQVICWEFDVAFRNLVFFEHIGVGRHDINDHGVTTPVKFSWEAPVVLEIDKKPSVAFWVFRPENFSNGAIWPTYGHISSLAYTQGVLGEFSESGSLVSQILGSIRLILHPVSQVFSAISLVLHPIREVFHSVSLFPGSVGLLSSSNGQSASVFSTRMHLPPLETNEDCGKSGHKNSNLRPSQSTALKTSHLALYLAELVVGFWCCIRSVDWLGYLGRKGHFGLLLLISGYTLAIHGGFRIVQSVTQKHLTSSTLCNTISDMANVLSADKQTAIIAALAEGSSIRSIERITGVHRDTIMRLGVRVGKGCAMLMDSKMQDLGCNYLQLDEVWGFIGKKERHCSVDDNPEYGDVWTFCAIDSETKLVPSFKCGKRNHETANAFVQDIANRVRNRVQISTDALGAYGEAVERAFGADVDYGQIVKVYVHDSAQHPERKYSAPHFASAYRRSIAGNPEMELVSTSHVERLNATTRLHVKRLSRLTLAFSKKFENFQAAVALHFAYYNFVRRHNTLRCTPAMAAGVERDFWSVGQLIEAAI
jgi:IS1 family transposase